MATTSRSLTVAEAAEALGVSERTVWRYLRSGRLHGETIGPVGQQRTLIDVSGVEAIQSGRGGEDTAALQAEVDRLSDELAALRAERDALEVEWDRLLLEQSAWATHPRIEQLARDQLGMVQAEEAQVVVVRR